MLSDPVWFFYQNWYPKYLVSDRDLEQADVTITWVMFMAAGVGSILGGWLAGPARAARAAAAARPAVRHGRLRAVHAALAAGGPGSRRRNCRWPWRRSLSSHIWPGSPTSAPWWSTWCRRVRSARSSASSPPAVRWCDRDEHAGRPARARLFLFRMVRRCGIPAPLVIPLLFWGVLRGTRT